MTSRIAVVALAAGLSLPGCDASTPTGGVGPFRLDIRADTGIGLPEVVDERQTVTVEAGSSLLLRVQLIDSRERPAPAQLGTTASSSNPESLAKLADFFDDRRQLMEFAFRALAPGRSTVVVANGTVGITRIVQILVEPVAVP